MIEVAALADLREADPIIVRAHNREIVLTLWRGDVYAIPNTCPHMLSTFEQGQVHGAFVGGPKLGQVEVDDGEPLIACPWHGWRYSLKTGKCVVDPKLRVSTYEVKVVTGKVMIGPIGKTR